MMLLFVMMSMMFHFYLLICTHSLSVKSSYLFASATPADRRAIEPTT
jgi:hypothetical protein